jgi:ribosomal subunit interface protein
MNLRVSGKNLDVGEALRRRVSARIGEAVAKYFDRGWSGRVTLAPEGPGYRAECVLHLDSGIVLQATGEASDPYLSCDNVAEHIEKRLRRYKRRLKDNRSGKPQPAAAAEPAVLQAASYVLSAPDPESEEDEAWNPAVIAESSSSLPFLSVREAVLELDLSGAPVLVFRHSSSGRANIVYRRNDGHIGWIDPPSTASKDDH